VKLGQHRQDWEELADLDLYWAILSDPARRDGGWTHEEFFESGRLEVASLLATVGRLRPDLPSGRALDFGCGAGRLARALAERFDHVVGVDIAERMIEEARRINADVPNCEFVIGSDRELDFPDGEFDLVYSSIVLQHLPSRADVRAYLSELVRVVAPGGLLAFQLITFLPWKNRIQPRRRLYHLLRRLGIRPSTLYRIRLQPISITFLPVADATRHLAASGGEVLEADTVDAGGEVVSTTFYVTVPVSQRV
jgi:ubiquinone/menaquinone biosynthesis C-methylase UbiE